MKDDLQRRYQLARQNVPVLFQRLDDLTGELGLPEITKKIKSYSDNIKQGAFKVMVMGDFNSGKSTLLNALIGDVCLPVKLTPATAIITVIRYGPEYKVTVTFTDGRLPEVYTGEKLKLFYEKYQLQSEKHMTRELVEHFAAVKEALLEYPTDLLKDGIELIDSPGLNESPLATRITTEYIPYADAVIMVLRANQLFTMQEKQYVQEILAPLGNDKIFYVINMWDLIQHIAQDQEKSESEIWERVKSELTPFLEHEGRNMFEQRGFRLSARDALLARRASPPDKALLEKSGLPVFLGALENYLLNDRYRAVLNLAAVFTRNLIRDEIDTAVHNIALTADTPVDELIARHRDIASKMPELNKVKSAVERDIKEVASLAANRVFQDVMNFATSMEKEKLPEAARRTELGNIGFFDLIKKNRRMEIEEKFSSSLHSYLQTEISRFCRGEVARQIKKYMGEVEDILKSHAGRFSQIISDMEKCFSGFDLELHLDRRPPLERWLFSGAGNALPDANKLLGQMSLGIEQFTRDIAEGIVKVVVQTLVAFLLVGGIFTFITGILGPILGAVFGAIGGLKKFDLGEVIKQKVAEEMATKLGGKMSGAVREKEDSIKKEIKQVFNRLGSGVANSIDGDAGNLQGSLNKVLEMKKKAEFRAGNMRQRLKEILDEAREIEREMENMAAEFTAV